VYLKDLLLVILGNRECYRRQCIPA